MIRSLTRCLYWAGSLLLISCSGSTSSGDESPPITDSFIVEQAFPQLTFSSPLALRHPGDETNRLFVVEQQGTIQVFENDASTTETSTFLDIQNQVSGGGERGLLGLAFHPDFASNGFFYINYTANNPARTIVSRFQVSAANPNRADPSSETQIISYQQPFSNHNGGQLSFGADGFLYIASGDGGSGGDPQGNGQNRSTLLGAILRIDIDGTENGNNYAIPPDNPFADNNQGFREEIYAYGLRNPFRFSFDPVTGSLWAADVGQNEFEEIDLIENGGNYGWNIVEGNACFNPGQNCDRTGLKDPVFVYDHSNGDRSVTGGFVYRGASLNELIGRYIFADFISGRIWALDISDADNPQNSDLIDTDLNISSFGIDADNELYICGFDGSIYQIVEE